MALESEALESGEIQALSDLALGRRARKNWAKCVVRAEQNGISKEQLQAFSAAGGFIKDDAGRKVIADGLGIDWAGLTAFMIAIAPIIEEMMASCGAV